MTKEECQEAFGRLYPKACSQYLSIEEWKKDIDVIQQLIDIYFDETEFIEMKFEDKDKHTGIYECSKCKDHLGEIEHYLFNYCPYCGRRNKRGTRE